MFGKKAMAISEKTRSEPEGLIAIEVDKGGVKGSAKSSSATVTKKAEAVLIVYGRDEKGKAHASSFGEHDRQAAIKAAHLMGFTALAVEQPAIKDIAEDLPQGRLFDSGKGFVPFVKDGVCLALEGHAKQFPRDIRALSESQIAELEPVVAGTSTTSEGKDKTVGAKKAAASSATTDDDASNGDALDLPTKSEPADDWMDIKVGTIVLAVDDPDDGWWEAKVTHAHKSGIGTNITTMLTLQWVLYPDEPSLIRRSNEVAYFPAGYGQVAPSDAQGTGAAS